jgi:hypothetical protein
MRDGVGMKRALTLVTAVALLTAALAACQPTTGTNTSNDQASSNPSVDITTHSVVISSAGATPTAAPTTPDLISAQHLADLDGDTRPTTDYQAALRHLAAKCTQSLDKVAGIVYATQDDLQQRGVNDETEYSLIQHLDQSIPAGTGRTDCISIAAAYATLRESK